MIVFSYQSRWLDLLGLKTEENNVNVFLLPRARLIGMTSFIANQVIDADLK